MRNFLFSLFTLYLCCQLFSGAQAHAKTLNSIQHKPLRIAVAANFAPILNRLLPSFTEQTQLEVQIISAASGTLYQQTVHGAPFDLFLSADSIRPALLEKEQLVVKNSRKTYAYGQLALWSAKKNLTDLSALSQPISRLAIANPATAPYGKAAKQVLEHLSIWPKVSDRLVTGININQTFQQVRSQAVSIGIVALSQLRFNKLQGVPIPSHYHQPIAQQLVILKSSKQRENAQLFSQFLMLPKTQKQLIALGYQSQVINERKEIK